MVPVLTEAALKAVAQTAFNYLEARHLARSEDKAEIYVQDYINNTIRSLGASETIQLAFQVALACAYTTFARTYPQWATTFFDEKFLNNAAAPFLARCLLKREAPDPVELAVAWADQIAVEAGVRHPRIGEIASAAENLIRFLRAELRARGELLQDYDALDVNAVERSSTSIERSVEALRAELYQALSHAAKYEVTVQEAKGLVIGDHATVTNTFQTFYESNYASLQEYYIPPDEVFERVRVDEFVGRAWLEDNLDQFLSSNDRGAWLLVGEAGIGKTSFLAHLVRERGYLHLFSEQAAGDNNLDRAIQNLVVQLIARFRIEPYAGRDTLPQTLSRYPDFLVRLLRSAAEKLGAGERLVIVVDALDQAGVPDGGNVLGLPRQLPRGIYLILTQRPKAVTLNIEPVPQRVDLRAEDFLNQGDIVAFLTQVASDQNIVEQLRDRGYTVQDFVRLLSERSGGNWIYLHYVLKEILNKHRLPLDLKSLPLGLVGYYAHYWCNWREQPQWDELYAPLLLTLAAAFEPLPLSTLKQWANVKIEDYRLRRLLKEEWGAFVYELGGEERRYRLYHLSLQEFLYGDVERDRFAPNVEGLLDELCERMKATHIRIIAKLEENCAGDWPAIASNPYVHRYLSNHLRLAGFEQVLFDLVNKQAWYEAQTRSDSSNRAYLTDLTQARAAAETANIAKTRLHQFAPYLGWEIRVAFAISSLHSYSTNIPAALVQALTQNGYWSPAEALAIARQNTDPSGRYKSTVATLPYLPDSLKNETVRDLLSAAYSINDRATRSEVYIDLIPHLPEDTKSDITRNVLDAAWATKDNYSRAKLFMKIAWHLSEPERSATVRAALGATRSVRDKGTQASIFLGLIPHLTEPEKSEVLHEALEAAQVIKNTYTRVQTLARLITYLREPERSATVHAALATARTVKEKGTQARVLAELVHRLPEPMKSAILDETLAATREIRHSSDQAFAMTLLARELPEPMRSKTLVNALSAARAIKDGGDRGRTLAKLSAYLSEGTRAWVHNKALEIQDRTIKAEVLVALVPHLPEAKKGDTILEVLEDVRTIESQDNQAKILTELLPHLPASTRSEVLPAILDISLKVKDKNTRAEAVTSLTPYLPPPLLSELLHEIRLIKDRFISAGILASITSNLQEPLKSEIVQETIAIANGIKNRNAQATVLVELTPYLPEPTRNEIVRDALAAAHGVRNSCTRVQALGKVIPYLPEPTRSETVRDALAVATLVEGSSERALALTTLAPFLAQLERPTLYPLWQEMLHLLAVHRRKHLLADIAALSPVITKLGGVEAMTETVRTILDVGQRWR